MKNNILAFAVVIALVTGCAGLAADSGKVQPSAAKQIMFAYLTDETGANDWVNWLTAKGFVADKFNASEANTTSFLNTDLIIIGYDTENAWGVYTLTPNTTAIMHTGLPVLGIGYGGYYYLWAAGAGTDGKGTGDSGLSEVYATNSSHTIWNKPNKITIPIDGNVTVHKSPVGGKSIDISYLPANVTVLANKSSDLGRCLITNETSQYFIWGFDTQSPSDLTSDGKKLMHNLIWFAIPSGYPVPEFDGSIYATAGFAGIMGAVAAVVFIAHRKRD